jgi:hypothetical protein
MYIGYIKDFFAYIVMKMIQTIDKNERFVKKEKKRKKSEPIFKEIIPNITDDRNRRYWVDFIKRHKGVRKKK